VLTESEGVATNSTAWSEGCALIEQAIARAGCTLQGAQLLDVLLSNAACENIRKISTTLDISAGTVACLHLSRILEDVLRLVQPFLIRMEVASEREIARVFQGMILDLCYGETFVGTWSLVTVIGEKPQGRSLPHGESRIVRSVRTG
jgi:hypothetical protein